MDKKVVILANGKFPKTGKPLGYLRSADIIVCCDGSVVDLLDFGLEPSVIVGDMDSIPDDLKSKYSEILYEETDDQDSNDLSKAVKYCMSKDFGEIVILGASGRREDHTIGNISLLLEYIDFLTVKMVTDQGVFIPLKSNAEIPSWPGQQVSIFSNMPEIEISSDGLKYPLNKMRLSNWWSGTLNEAISEKFRLRFDSGKILIFLAF